jgi:hypothetical protein
MKVNLFLVGVAKSATNSIFDLLSGHPEICPCDIKEVEFFARKDTAKELELNSYHDLFKCTDSKYYLDASDLYSSSKENRAIAEQIFSYNPEARILYCIRNPIERIQSQHWHDYNRGWTRIRDINQAVSVRNYIQDSMYFSNLQPYIELFGKEQISVLLFEDLRKKPEVITTKLAAFLELKSIGFKKSTVHSNKSGSLHWINHRFDRFVFNPFSQKMKNLVPVRIQIFVKELLIRSSKRLKDRPELNEIKINEIKSILLPEIKKIEEFTGFDLSHWYK